MTATHVARYSKTEPYTRPKPANDPELIAFAHRWDTLRSGSPLSEIVGWGLGLAGVTATNLKTGKLERDEEAWAFRKANPDLLELRRELQTQEYDPAWRLDVIAPRKLNLLEAVQGMPTASIPVARRKLEGDIKRERFLSLITRGMRIQATCDHIGVSRSTYQKWRSRYPEFKASADRAIAHRRMREHDEGAGFDPDTFADEHLPYDDTFTSRRMHFFGYDTYDHHARIIEALESAPPLSVTLIIVPPGAGKTTVLEDYVKDTIAHDPNHRILWVSEKADSDSPVGKAYANVKEFLTDPAYDNPDSQYPTRALEFQERFGPFRDEDADKNKPWNTKFMKVHKASGRRDFTIQVCGWRSKVYGARADTLIVDDVQSSDSINQTEAILDRLTKTFFNRTLNPTKPGRVFIIGTLVGMDDVYQEMIKREIPNKVIMIPALDEHGNSYCPEMYSEEVLEQVRKSYGEEAWWTAFMMAPQQVDTATFLPEDIEKQWRSEHVARVVPDETWRVMTMCDPALQGGNAVVTAAYNADHFMPIDVRVDRRLGRNEAVIDRIATHFKYNPTDLIIEKNTGEGIGRDDRLEEMARLYGFSIHLHHTDARKNNDKVIWGVGGMAAGFIRNEIILPEGGEGRKVLAPLVHELEQWRPSSNPNLLRQDLVMALWFGWVHWLKMREYAGMSNIGEEWQTGAMPWQRGDMSGGWGRPDLPSDRRLAMAR